MSYINLGLIIVAGLNICLALLVWLRNPKNKINIYYAIAVMFVGLWAFGMAMFREAPTEFTARIWTWIQNGAGSLIVIPLLFFSFVFPYPTKRISLLAKVLIFLSVLVELYVVVMPGVWYSQIYLEPHRNNYEINYLGYFYFVVYILFYFIWALYNLVKKFLVSEGFQKQQLKYIILATTILGFAANFFATILPYWQNVKYIWPGPYFSIATFFFIYYFIFVYSKKV